MDSDEFVVDSSTFDFSVENYFGAIDRIANLCGEIEGNSSFEKADIVRLSSRTTFLREWRHFYYQSKTVRFACETEHPPVKNVVSEINIPQFSAATVTKEILSGNAPSGLGNDFVLYIGGTIWALDWCPRVLSRLNNNLKCEFIAVSAHPPGSSYHKMGTPLTGRGMVQIWCLLHIAEKEEDMPLSAKKRRQKSISNPNDKSIVAKMPRGRPRKNNSNANHNATELKKSKGRPKRILNETDKANPPKRSKSTKGTQQKKPRGRPKKISIYENEMMSEYHSVQTLSIEYPMVSSEMPKISWNGIDHTTLQDPTQNKTGFSLEVFKADSPHAVSMNGNENKAELDSFRADISIPVLMQSRDHESSAVDIESIDTCGQDILESKQAISDNPSLELIPIENFIPTDLILPRVVLCLAHNGKVAWDVKWRPCRANDPECKSRMGYLAVLLGNGSLEVWEVPSPCILKILYSRNSKRTDPRFVKLDPVFKCSKLQCGHRQSIPLAVEWSASIPHDLLLAGCHDGTVAVWKFSTDGSCKDTRPLLCFNADSDAIRALAWAPSIDNDLESANVIVTAGHEGIKFWDIRDPFRPLWDFNSGRRVIYSLDWLPDPKCLVLSFDDGTLRILSLLKAAFDTPVTGKVFAGTQFQGYHTHSCSQLAIWSVHVSRIGKVAYCNADGTALNFQLTRKAVEGDARRNRAPHFLCGSFTLDDSQTLTVNSPFPDTPFLKRNAPKTFKGFSFNSGQARTPMKPPEPKCQNPSEDQILSICYGDEPGMEFVGDRCPSAASLRKKDPNVENRGRKSRKEEAEIEVEVLPPKIVAMHRVRWNMNKGSHNWLCYGGSAGILRCQHIPNN